MIYDITYHTIPGTGPHVRRTMTVQSSLPTSEIWEVARRMAHRTEYSCEGDQRPGDAYQVLAVTEVAP